MALATALSSAVAGLKAQQTGLDVVSNNISNVNTTAYKAQTVTFSDKLSQTISSASSGTATKGSVNAQQIGMGVGIAATSTNTAVGTTTSSSSATDVALTGAGYFVVKLADGSYAYTRDGSLSIDENGNLTINGNLVCGWEAYTLDADGNKVYTTSGSVEPINVWSDAYAGSKKLMAATETTEANFSGNLNSSKTASGTALNNIGDTSDLDWDETTTMKVVDEQGNSVDVTVKFEKGFTSGSITSWYWEASGTDTTITPSSGYIAFDSEGNMVTTATPLTSTLYTNAANVSSATASSVAANDYTFTVASDGTGGYTYALKDADGTSYTAYTTDTSANTITFTVGTGTITLALPSTTATGSTTFNVNSAGTATLYTNTAGYDSSDISLTSGLAAGTYTITVSSDGKTVMLTDPANNTYSGSVSSDGSVVLTTASGTVTLDEATLTAGGSATFNVTEGTAVTFDSALSLSVKLNNYSTDPVAIAADFSKMTSASAGDADDESTASCDVDGILAGTLSGSYSIGSDGTIYAYYSNEQKQSVGQISLAVFDNPGGLTKDGDNLYTSSSSSGECSYVVAGEDGSGEMTSYALELSNVDLASEFSNMMIFQRAYQGNSKVITAQDDMLQTLINMI